MFKNAATGPLPWSRLIMSILPPVYLNFILILYFHLRTGRASGLFYSGFTSIILHEFLFCPMRATLSAYLILLRSQNWHQYISNASQLHVLHSLGWRQEVEQCGHCTAQYLISCGHGWENPEQCQSEEVLCIQRSSSLQRRSSTECQVVMSEAWLQRLQMKILWHFTKLVP